ncbi:major facilitator superfamily arabinose transmembrane efflux protein [Neoasaia chiangmaiensis NBRC 101099]|uniref:MFS transporter n=1 Tax=Neoasaia chiangmaiensis TaxID=320497 RepID=A0A1U9KNR3_9PROT|nr:MFS transporter [Neoasaia chiangmaiensis]AQS87428.1 MFS transporter [Neoasaia chiangmaiensis]GBR42752.1 major facilitator superfamily arabinose transmembrane efflux protein [Neoasaia chiangmaiensis NBRC 101099]GEN16204.1 MFS transporter [Neoasaia chiangmaiensis]
MSVQAHQQPASVSAIFFALGLGGFAIGTAEFAAMSLVPMIARDLGISAPEAGHAIVTYAAGVCVGAPTIALFSAKVSRRTMLIGMMLLYMIGNGLSALAPNYWTLLLCRFITGLPHGAYFGIAGVVASSLVPPHRRSQAVGRVVLGLTIATIGGVPMANLIGQAVGWRWAFVLIAMLSLCTAVLVATFAPRDPPRHDASIMAELDALRRPQVWLTLGIGAVGFGSVFCVYTYLASIMLEVTHTAPTAVPVMLAVFGAGLTLGTLVCAWLADRRMMPTIGGVLLVEAASMAGFPSATHDIWSLGAIVFSIGCGGGLATVVQSRLLEVATGAEGFAAALNQSAFNIANAVGPYLGGLAIAAGLGWTSVGWVGLALALGGFAIWLVSVAEDARTRRVTQGQ